MKWFAAAVVVFLPALLATGTASASAFCLTLNRVADAQGLRSYTDTQVENGTCMTARETAQAIARGDNTSQDQCIQATTHMVKEFQRRFPGRSARTTAGRC